MEFAVATRPARSFSLRHVLVADALTCLLFGLALVAAATPLAAWLGLPRSLLFGAGVVLFPCAGLMALTAKTLDRRLVLFVIAGNLAWVVASVGVSLLFEPTGFGLVFILGQALAVAGIAGLEWRSLAGRSHI